jgi:hypothetical protein
MTGRGAFLAVLLAALLPAAPACAKVTFSSTRALAFGRFVAGTGGTVIVPPVGARTKTGGVVLLTSTATSANLTYTDTSPPNASNTCSISLPTAPVTVSNGTNTMQLNTFTSSPSGSGTMSGGNLTIQVGATMAVTANQPKGNYTGSFTVTLTCN